MVLVPGRRTWLLDADSIGINPRLSEDENRSRFNYCYITQGVVGIGGDISALSARHLAWFRRVTDEVDRGHKVFCPDRQAFLGHPLPNAYVVEYPRGSRRRRAGIAREVGYFNWGDEPAVVGYPLSALGVWGDARITDFWTGRSVAARNGFLTATLRPRASRVFCVHA